MKRLLSISGLLLTLIVSPSLRAVHIVAEGVVARPGATLNLNGSARLSDGALAARPQTSAYMLGAAWLRAALRQPQQRLKAGLVFDLDILRQRARSNGQDDLLALAEHLHQWVDSMDVTGRQPALLDPRVVEVTPSLDHLLANGDRLYYPSRPKNIRIVGAVDHPCALPLMPLLDAHDYLRSCPMSLSADHDLIYVIEPDGRVSKQGIALWNRGAKQFLAPGAMIYVPLRAAIIRSIDPALNTDMATFMATQLLPASGMPQ